VIAAREKKEEEGEEGSWWSVKYPGSGALTGLGISFPRALTWQERRQRAITVGACLCRKERGRVLQGLARKGPQVPGLPGPPHSRTGKNA
jgi:hypothetical protein